MWVYLDVLLPLLENTANLVNITPVADIRRSTPALHGGGAAGGRSTQGSLDRDGNARDAAADCTDSNRWRDQGQGNRGGNEQSGFGRRQENERWMNDSGARPNRNSAGTVISSLTDIVVRGVQ